MHRNRTANIWNLYVIAHYLVKTHETSTKITPNRPTQEPISTYKNNNTNIRRIDEMSILLEWIELGNVNRLHETVKFFVASNMQFSCFCPKLSRFRGILFGLFNGNVFDFPLRISIIFIIYRLFSVYGIFDMNWMRKTVHSNDKLTQADSNQLHELKPPAASLSRAFNLIFKQTFCE